LKISKIEKCVHGINLKPLSKIILIILIKFLSKALKSSIKKTLSPILKILKLTSVSMSSFFGSKIEHDENLHFDYF
jgi:hypothetical protein